MATIVLHQNGKSSFDLAKEAVEGGVKSQPDSDDEEVPKKTSENQDEEQTDHETENQLDAKEVDSAEEAEEEKEEKEEIEELEVEEKEEENEKDVSMEDIAEFATDVDPAVEVLKMAPAEIILEDSSENNDNKETELEKETNKDPEDAIEKVR